MSHTKVNYEDVEQVGNAMHFLGEPLETEQVGVTVARCDPGWNSRPHDHVDNEHEEVYVLIEGQATVVIDDEEVGMETGDAVWIPPDSTRQIKNGDDESAFVLVSAPSISDDDGEGGDWPFVGMTG